MYRMQWAVDEDGIDKTFKQIAKDILEYGRVSHPRGKQTKQCIGATVIMDPQQTLIRNKRRKLNYVFALVEKLVYTTGNGLYAGILDWYNTNYVYYQDGMDIGNYCWRIAPQLRRTVQTLRDDPDSRQAVIAIYNNLFDQRPTKDTPCTLNLQFFVRQGKLDMVATMRSNDLLWGFSYDINQFSFIQKLIAGFLGIPTGVYVHHSNNLHIYESAYKDFENIIACDDYFTETQQPDLVPVYGGLLTPTRRMDAFFKDAETFWKLEGMTRFADTRLVADMVDEYRGKLDGGRDSGFFLYALQKCLKYNFKKASDKQHLRKYFPKY